MNSNLLVPRILVGIVGIVPTIVGLLWAKYYDFFPKNSLRRFASLILVWVLSFGPVLIQDHIYRGVFHAPYADRFFMLAVIVQFSIALVIFLWMMFRRSGRDPDRHA